MKISVVCDGCGRRLEVDPALAGRRGKCPNCRQIITIPAAEKAPPPISAEEGYGLGEEPDAPAPMTFVHTPAKKGARTQGATGRTARRPKQPRRARSRDTGIDWNSTGVRRALKIGIGVVVVLAVVAVFVPRMMIIVGSVFAAVGLILTLYGYVTAIYIAFTEDDLHGWLALMLPFYAAYYLVSRWDEMKSRLVMILIGLALSSAGSWMIETGRARSRPADSPEAQASTGNRETPLMPTTALLG